MDELYRSYLGFLRSMDQGLESLIELNLKKLAAAQKDDLMALSELLNQEQAQALNFRGLELTRDKLLPQLGLTGVPLFQVPERFPPAMREEARQAVEAYVETLREVESAIVQMGGPPAGAESGPGYGKAPESAPPPSMKTDFRA